MIFRGAESEECWDEVPLEGVFVFEFEFGSDVRSVSSLGGCGDFEGLEFRDICEGDRDCEDGNEESEVLRFTALPLELVVPFVEGRYMGWTCADAMAVRIRVSWVAGC